MHQIILITGGGRSGKSAFAQSLAERLPDRRLFLATGAALDEEMALRIRAHQQARQAASWQTLEEPLKLAEAVRSSREYGVVLVDCLTLWINNLMHAAGQSGRELDEDEVARLCRDAAAACASHPGSVLLVTNEVGLGIVPDNALARRYRDFLGRCNQIFAAAAQTVVFMSCGIPLPLKGSLP